jgi:hypothetical protein
MKRAAVRKIERAAALSLVGWYLMMPPVNTLAGASPGVVLLSASPDDAVKATISSNPWIAKLKHVKQVTYGLVNGNVTIVVFVDKAENVSEVSRQVPSRIEGFPVDVEEVTTIYPY